MESTDLDWQKAEETKKKKICCISLNVSSVLNSERRRRQGPRVTSYRLTAPGKVWLILPRLVHFLVQLDIPLPERGLVTLDALEAS